MSEIKKFSIYDIVFRLVENQDDIERILREAPIDYCDRRDYFEEKITELLEKIT